MSKGNVMVRVAGPDDLDAVLRLAGELRESTGGRAANYPRFPLQAGDPDTRDRYHVLLGDPTRALVLAVDAGTDAPIGLAVFARDTASEMFGSSALSVSHLIVAAEHRRRGAGHRLVGAALAHADEIGCDQVVVGVAVSGREVHRFFARLGFAPLITRRIASVSTLRRTLGPADRVGVSGLRRLRRIQSPRPPAGISLARSLRVRRLSGRNAG